MQKVAHQNAGGVAEAFVGGGATASHRGFIYHIIVQQGGGVDQLHDGGKIEALRRAIELQQREVLRIRGEHSRRVCRDAVGEHVALVARVARAVEEMHAANRAEQEFRANIEAEGYSGTLLPAMAFTPHGVDYFDTRDVDGGYAPSWARDAGDYIASKALPVEVYEKQAAREAAAAPRRVPKLAARVSYPGEGELIA